MNSGWCVECLRVQRFRAQMYATFCFSERPYSLITGGGKSEQGQRFRFSGNFMKPLLAWIVNRTHGLKRLRGARSAQHRQNCQRKWVDVLEGFVRTAALPSVPPKTRTHMHTGLPLLLLSPLCFLSPYVTCPQSLANQWALSPITPHNDPLFEPTDICGGGKKRELQAAVFCLVLLQRAALIWLCLEKWVDQARLSRGSSRTYPGEGTSEPQH